MGIDLVNSSTGATILTYALNNIAANGGTGSDTESLVNITLPNSIGFKITSLTSPGSGTSLVAIEFVHSAATLCKQSVPGRDIACTVGYRQKGQHDR